MHGAPTSYGGVRRSKVHREVHQRCGAVQSAPECTKDEDERWALRGCTQVQGAPRSNGGVRISKVHREVHRKMWCGAECTECTKVKVGDGCSWGAVGCKVHRGALDV